MAFLFQNRDMFKGAMTALITPFQDNQLDLFALEQLVRFQMESGIQGLVICGSTGEGGLLKPIERDLMITKTLEFVQGRIPVIVGCGSSATHEASAYIRRAKILGADGALVVSPYYCKPSQDGLFEHFNVISEECDLPLIVYNNPGRSVVEISIETALRIAELQTVRAFKESTLDLMRITYLRAHLPENISMLCGEDGPALGFMVQGAQGIISAGANVVPELLVQMFNDLSNSNLAAAAEKNTRWCEIMRDLYRETNPVGMKYGASLRGLCQEDMRLPLLPPCADVKKHIRHRLSNYGIIAHEQNAA